jgi:hypothetical protein
MGRGTLDSESCTQSWATSAPLRFPVFFTVNRTTTLPFLAVTVGSPNSKVV